MVAQATQDAVQQSDRTLTALHASWDAVYRAVEIVREHGGNTLPLLDECDRIAGLVRAETARHREVSRCMALEVVATAEELLGKWWDNDQHGESVLTETADRFLYGDRDTAYADDYLH